MGYVVRTYLNGYWYHVYTRGQRRQPLFFSPSDRVQYLRILDRELCRGGGCIGSFALMTNHVHLLLKMGRTPLGRILQYAHSQYAVDFNTRRGTVGHVTQGRPGVKIVLDEEYLWALVGYLHRNALEAGMVKRVTDYKWSSWYWFEGKKCDWINLDSWCFPPGFEGRAGRASFRNVVDRGEHSWPSGMTYIGTEDQWNLLERRRQPGRPSQMYKERRDRKSMEEIAGEFIKRSRLSLQELRGSSSAHEISAVRKQAMVQMHAAGHGTSEIARWFNRTPGTVSKACKKERA